MVALTTGSTSYLNSTAKKADAAKAIATNASQTDPLHATLQNLRVPITTDIIAT